MSLLSKKGTGILPLADFVALVENKQCYSGLVESVGYVYWTEKTYWFEHVNADDRWALPIYHQISSPVLSNNRRRPIKSKVVYTLNIMLPEELKGHNKDMYYEFYGFLFEMPNMQVDALRVNRMYPSNGSGRNVETNDVFRLGSRVDDAIGAPLGMAGMLTDNKALGNVGTALTGLSILHDIDRGEYWSAGGKVLLFAITQFSKNANVYAGLFSFGSWIYKSDYMQRQLAREYAKAYKQLGKEYNRLFSKDPNHPNLSKINEKMKVQLQLFKQCMDNLGIAY